MQTHAAGYRVPLRAGIPAYFGARLPIRKLVVPLCTFALRIILPCRYSPSEFLSFKSRPIAFATSPLPIQGSARHSGHIGGIHSDQGVPNPCSVPPSGFLNLPTVSSTLRFHGLVSSRNHLYGFRCSGSFSPCSRRFLIKSNVPPCR
jgi:hypothetical protein